MPNHIKWKEISNTLLAPRHKKIKESVLCEHIRSIDYEIRNLKYVETTSDADFKNVMNLLETCLENL